MLANFNVRINSGKIFTQKKEGGKKKEEKKKRAVGDSWPCIDSSISFNTEDNYTNTAKGKLLT